MVERETNWKMLGHIKDQPVNYGEEIQFLHIGSKQFLNGKIVCSEADQNAYEFELSSQYQAGMVFKILPKFKLRQEGENVQFRDQIWLYNIKLNGYVNFYSRSSIQIDKPLDLPTTPLPYTQPIYRSIANKEFRHEAFLAHYHDVTLKLLLHCSDDQKFPRKDYIKGGDIIRLEHTELGGFISAD